MSNRIRVQVAAADRRVPVEGRQGVYFEHGIAHDVRNTPFVQRRIKEGDLVEVPATAEDATPAATKGE